MQFSGITVLLFFLYYVYSSTNLNYEMKKLKDKYNYHPVHYGYFADKNLLKILNEDDLTTWKTKAKRFSKIQICFVLYAILIFMISGIFFGGKL